MIRESNKNIFIQIKTREYVYIVCLFEGFSTSAPTGNSGTFDIYVLCLCSFLFFVGVVNREIQFLPFFRFIHILGLDLFGVMRDGGGYREGSRCVRSIDS